MHSPTAPLSSLDRGLSSEPWGTNVLLVEDHRGDAQRLEQMLERVSSSFHIYHVHRRSEAMAVLQTQDFSAILLDLSLPDGAGLDLIREVASIAPKTAIVALTSSVNLHLALEALQAGAQDFLVKEAIEDSDLLRSVLFSVERKRTAMRLIYLAHYDALTGLSNRASFRDRVSVALTREEPCAVLFLDLDRFKHINDTLGHEAGDQLLVQFAERLKKCVGPQATVGRLGGDEFVVLVEAFEGRASVEAIARKILHSMTLEFDLGVGRRRMSTSIGVAVAEAGDSVDSILERADEAMYRAKKAGRDTFVVAASGKGSGSPTPEELERALENHELELVYQPKLCLRSGQVVGAEALLRWNRPSETLQPSEVLPLLDKTGLSVAIGDWVLRHACQQAQRWRTSECSFRLAVNIAQEQFDRAGLVDTVADVLAETGFPPHCLELELTESVLLRDLERSRRLVSDLRSLGVRLALDDFSAQSSLKDLSSLPLDIIKLDRSLVAELSTSAEQKAIVSAVIHFSRGMGVEIVAEGVETADEQEVVGHLGCDTAQGFYVCGPMDCAGFTVWLATQEADGDGSS